MNFSDHFNNQFVSTPTIRAFHSFVYKEQYYVIAIERMTAHVIDRNVAQSLRLLASNPLAELSDEVLDRLSEIGLPCSPSQNSQSSDYNKPAPVAIKNISLFIPRRYRKA